MCVCLDSFKGKGEASSVSTLNYRIIVTFSDYRDWWRIAILYSTLMGPRAVAHLDECVELVQVTERIWQHVDPMRRDAEDGHSQITIMTTVVFIFYFFIFTKYGSQHNLSVIALTQFLSLHASSVREPSVRKSFNMLAIGKTKGSK